MSLPSARSIAFNRRLSAAWLQEGLRLRAEGVDDVLWTERMEEVVSSEISGKDSITKSMRYLRHIWGNASGDDPLRDAGIGLYKRYPKEETAKVLSWGMAIGTYPFLNEVAVALGRMLRIQSEVKLEQILRKLSETHGEKETVRRSSRYSLSLICDLGFAERTSSVGCYQLAQPTLITDPGLAGWLFRAWFRATSRGADPVDRTSIANAPSLAFFNVHSMISDALQDGTFEVERLSYSQDSLRLTH